MTTIDETISPEDLQITKIVQSILANQVALNFNEELRHTSYYKHKLKQNINVLNIQLLKAEKQDYNHFIDVVEENSDFLYNLQFDVINELTSLGLSSFGEVLLMLKAYKKNKKSMNGIAHKINKQP
mgnify:CR=1 FL=1